MFQWRKQSKRKELNRETSKRKRSMDGELLVDTMLTNVQTLQRQDVRVFSHDSDDEVRDFVKDFCAPGRSEERLVFRSCVSGFSVVSFPKSAY